MAFGKRLHISGEMQPGNLLTKLVETEVINMWIYGENIIWILWSLRSMKYISKIVFYSKQGGKMKLLCVRNKKNNGRKQVKSKGLMSTVESNYWWNSLGTDVDTCAVKELLLVWKGG